MLTSTVVSEAAQIDGVTPLQFLFKILIPLSWNAIGALLVIQFIYGWNMYPWPLLLQPDDQLVQVGLGGLRNADQGQAYGPADAGSAAGVDPAYPGVPGAAEAVHEGHGHRS